MPQGMPRMETIARALWRRSRARVLTPVGRVATVTKPVY